MRDENAVACSGESSPSTSRFFVKASAGVVRDTSLSDGAFRLFMVLKLSAWELGYTEATEAELGEELGRSSKTASRYLDELKKAGKVAVQRRGLGLPNKITVLECVAEKAERETRWKEERARERQERRNSRVDMPVAPDRTPLSGPCVRTDSRSKLTTSGGPEAEAAAAALARAGCDPKIADQLVRLYGVDLCQRALAQLARERSVRSPGRWLYAAITRGCYGSSSPPSPQRVAADPPKPRLETHRDEPLPAAPAEPEADREWWVEDGPPQVNINTDAAPPDPSSVPEVCPATGLSRGSIAELLRSRFGGSS